MNLDIEFTVKIKASDKATLKPYSLLIAVINKLAAHPGILLVLRAFTKG
jgi:hypothetical protein